MEKKSILYRATGEGSEEQCQNYMERWVLPVDEDAEIKQDDTTKGESWIVMGTQKIVRKPQVVKAR